jgi:hypothetical protein
MRNAIILVLALLGAVVATGYNHYSQCREWRLELALRDQGVAPERSWGIAAVDFVAGDLIAVGKKWQCGIAITGGEAAWATVEAITIVPVLGTAAVWVARTVGRGFSRMAVLLREATAVRSAGSFIRGPMSLVGKITARRGVVLFVGGILLAVYFGAGQLLLDALALLPWIAQVALWAVVFFSFGKGVELAVRAVTIPLRAVRRLWWRSGARPLAAAS